jgi:hypothetical protein
MNQTQQEDDYLQTQLDEFIHIMERMEDAGGPYRFHGFNELDMNIIQKYGYIKNLEITREPATRVRGISSPNEWLHHEFELTELGKDYIKLRIIL